MDKIVSLQERIESRRRKEQRKLYFGKVETIQKLIQCSSCHVKCAMCGLQIHETEPSSEVSFPSMGLAFCESCGAEFEDFLAVSKGKKESDVFWHNEEWVKMWSTWLKYRQAIHAFMDSTEFQLLLDELDSHS